MNSQSSDNSFISKIHLLQKYCSKEQKSLLEQRIFKFNCKKDDLIFQEGQHANNIFFIASGIVELWKEGVYIHKQVIRFATQGDVLGYRGIIMENSQYHLSATAFEDVTIYSIEKNIFKEVLNENHELNFNILLTYTKELEKVETRLRDLTNMNVREKVAEAFLILHNIYSAKNDNASLSVSVPLSRQDIADIAGTSKGRIIKQIAEFRDEKILTGNGKKIIILKPDRLRDIVKGFHS